MEKKIDAQAFESNVVKLFKLTAEEIASLYNEAGELTNWALIESKDTERVSKFKTDNKSQYDLGFKKGAESLESKIKTKYPVDSDLTGIELFDHIVETKVGEVKVDNSEDILKHPEVIRHINSIEKEHSKAIKATVKEWEDKLVKKESEINESLLFSEIESAALADFDSFDPVLPDDPKKVKAWKDIYIAEIKKQKHQKDKDGFSVLKDDGTLLTDDHGHPITFTDRNRSVAAKWLDFRVAKDRNSPGLTEEQRRQQQGDKTRTPKDNADFLELMKDQSLTPEERSAILKKATEAKII